jgi:hypothetical protein
MIRESTGWWITPECAGFGILAWSAGGAATISAQAASLGNKGILDYLSNPGRGDHASLCENT